MDAESELVRRLAHGDESALGRLYERLGGNVYSLALHMLGTREDAEEVLQDAFVKLYRNASKFDPSLGTARAYLYTIARNEARMRLRSRSSRPATAPLEDKEGVLAAPADRDRQAIDGALSQLDGDELSLLQAAFFDGYSHAELARHTGLPLGTLKSRIRRALRKLRGALGEAS